jgi:hypothetical protein
MSLFAAAGSDLGVQQFGIGGILGDAWDAIKDIADDVVHGAASAAFHGPNMAAKELINQIPWEIVRDSLHAVRKGIASWIGGKDVELGSTEPGQPGGARPRGGGVAGLVEPVAGIAARMLALGGGRIHIVSGWRDSRKQAQLYAAYLAGTGNLAARPGTSKHERGLAVDWGGNQSLYQSLARSMGAHFPVRGEPWHMEVPGYARGGVLPFIHANSFDSGGVLEPGWNVVRNDTGAPEAVSPNGGPAVAIAEANFYEGVDYDLFLRKTAFMAAAGSF